MKSYEWMVKPTPQKEWIEQRGILLWLAFFFIELGAGSFFVASFFRDTQNVSAAMLAGWLVCSLLGGGLHILYLGHPARLWRLVKRPGTSWISRGLIFVGSFLALALIYMVLAEFANISATALLTVADILAFLSIIYGGFAMNFVKGITLWNSPLLPVLYVVSGIWGGAGIALAVALARGSANTGASVEEWIRVLLISYVVLLAVYLVSVRYTSLTGNYSVQEILIGRWWLLTWVGVVGLGLVLPIVVVVASYALGLDRMASGILYMSIFCEMLGDMTMRYLILKCGFYSPLAASTQ